MSASLERLARNQALFREVNERLLVFTDGSSNGRLDFLCECSQEGCAETVDLELKEYETIRLQPTHFVISPGHETEAIETVVEAWPTYAVVKKTNGAAFAVETDPRESGGAVR
jgi:hypothetical protein